LEDRFVSRLGHRLEPPAEVRRFEVINGAMGRRRWSTDERARILEETLAPGAVVSAVARRHGLTPQQLFTWRREARKRLEVTEATPVFVPAVIAPEPMTTEAASAKPRRRRARRSPLRRREAAIELEASGVIPRARSTTCCLGPMRPRPSKPWPENSVYASALGEPCVSISMTTATGINPLGGADAVWRNPRIGLVAEALITHGSASPMLFLDEIDKPFSAGNHDRPLDPLHTLLEPQTARSFKDELVELMFDTSQITWLATANDLGPIPPAIVDRFLVLEAGTPAASQMGAMIKLMVATAMAAHHDWFEAVIDDAVIARLSALHPRRLRRVVEMACTAAAAAGERKLAEHHIQRAIRLIEAGVTRPPMGFRI
jgi:transposase